MEIGKVNFIRARRALEFPSAHKLLSLLGGIFKPVVDERQKSQIKKRKRNLNSLSSVSKREIIHNILNFREEEEKDFLCSSFERRKRNFKYISPI